jgi:hypothetical protein
VELRAHVKLLQEQLTAVEADNAAMRELMLRRIDEADAANERVRVLESVLREIVRCGDKLSWSLMSDMRGWVYGIAKDALTPAPPAALPDDVIAAQEMMVPVDATPADEHPTREHLLGALDIIRSCIVNDDCKAAVEHIDRLVTYQPSEPFMVTLEESKPAETPAPNVLHAEDIRYAVSMLPDRWDAAKTRLLRVADTLARDASADAPDWQQMAHDRYIAIMQRDDEIDRLKAELDAEKKRADEATAKLVEVERVNEQTREDARKQYFASIDATTAKLGRAVAALQTQCDEHAGNCASWCMKCQEGRISRAEVLADADSAQAGEAWAEMVETLRFVDAQAEYYQGVHSTSVQLSAARSRIAAALAKVESRRGLVKP